jgi:hypothetical protein
MVRRLFGLLIVAGAVLGLASCGAGPGEPALLEKGVVTGTAVPCAGPMAVPTAHLAVFEGTRLVATGRFRTGAPFRFVLPAGRYVITNNAASPAFGTGFRIRAGHVDHVVVLDACD